MEALTKQRVRITFGKRDALRFVGHLDLSKTWERALRRVQFPLEYTQGFNARPRLQFAAALPVGVTSDCELLDVWLTERLEGDFPDDWIARLNDASPPGLRIYDLAAAQIKSPALPTLVQQSEYLFTFAHDPGDLQERIDDLLASPKIVRTTRKKPYDLRPRILDLALAADGSLIARLSSSEHANARPDELLDALGYELQQARIHRRKLILDGGQE